MVFVIFCMELSSSFLFGSFDHFALDLLEKMLALDPENVSKP